MEIIISGKDKKLLEQVEALAKRLGLEIKRPIKKKKEKKKNRSEELYKLMEEMAKDGGLFQSIEDPVAWQREQRKDRALPGREE